MEQVPSSFLITDFWQAAQPPRGYEEEVARFRELIVQTQTTSCAHTCSVRKNLWVGGSAQNLRRLSHALLEATLQRCAIVGHWPQWVYASVATGKELRQRCTASGRLSLHCYFRPISKCSHNSSSNGQRHRDSSSFRFLSSTIDLSHRLDQLGNLTGLRSEVLVMGTLLSWIMRPQPELRLAIEQYGAALGLSPNGSSSSRREVRHRQLALHIRRGDKYSLHAKHMHNHTWRVSPASFIAWSRRIASDIGAERVLYMTDDVRGLDLARHPAAVSYGAGGLFRLAPGRRECMPSFLSASTRVATSHSPMAKVLPSIAKHPELWMKHAQALQPELGKDCGPDVLLDDGIQLFAGIMLLAQCAAFVGTLISNIGGLIVELMATQHHPPAFYDVLNDVHRPFLSDERVWYGAIHNPKSVRPLRVERLAQGGSRSSHGTWMEEGRL